LPGTLPTPPSMRVRSRRFHEDEQALPRGFSDSRHPAKLTNRSSFRHHLRSSYPYAKVLCDSCRVGSLAFAGPSLLASSEYACEQFQLRSDRWTYSSRRLHHSQASIPGSVALPQLPSTRAFSRKLSFGALFFQGFLSRVHGTPMTQAHDGRTQTAPELPIGRFLQTTRLAPARRCKAFMTCSRLRRLWVIITFEVNHDRQREQNP